MDLRKRKKPIDLVEEQGITKLEVSEGEDTIRIAKHPSIAPQKNLHDSASRNDDRSDRQRASHNVRGTIQSAGRGGHQVAQGRYLLSLGQPGLLDGRQGDRIRRQKRSGHSPHAYCPVGNDHRGHQDEHRLASGTDARRRFHQRREQHSLP